MDVVPVSEWLAIDQWHMCRTMERPGIIFELRNAEGQRMFTQCTETLPAAPFDWTSSAVTFRAVREPPPKRSAPIPEPKG